MCGYWIPQEYAIDVYGSMYYGLWLHEVAAYRRFRLITALHILPRILERSSSPADVCVLHASGPRRGASPKQGPSTRKMYSSSPAACSPTRTRPTPDRTDAANASAPQRHKFWLGLPNEYYGTSKLVDEDGL